MKNIHRVGRSYLSMSSLPDMSLDETHLPGLGLSMDNMPFKRLKTDTGIDDVNLGLTEENEQENGDTNNDHADVKVGVSLSHIHQ